MLAVAHAVLGGRAVALTAVAETFPPREREEAAAFCRSRGIRQVEVPIRQLAIPGFAENSENRCYLCKKALFSTFWEVAHREGLAFVCEDSNLDDLGDFRPGLRACRELGIRSPLREADLTKAEIRALSKALGLPTWDKPSYACLASRIPYGQPLVPEQLSMVEQAEAILMEQGFRQVRVRLHGDLARIEVPAQDIEALAARREALYPALKALGFSYVALDLLGYRTGSLNET